MKKNIKTYFVIVLTCLAIVVFGVVLRYSFFYAPSLEAQTTNQPQNNATKEDPPASSYPKELIIPSINVNSKVVYVGVTKLGNMATPNNFTDVGWYEYGKLPGEEGTAVIAGHVNDGVAFPAVFGNLNKVNIGDDVFVDTVSGGQIHFVVTNIATYDFNAPTQEIFNQNNGKYLKLITCSGVWVNKYKTHNKRLVVTAEEI
jgi:LPXTG-site transpeptidase (sortase) family protein